MLSLLQYVYIYIYIYIYGQQSKSTSYVNTDRSLQQSNDRRATFLAREGRYGDAARSLQSQGCASENDSDALQDLINRHPLHPLPSWSDELPPALCTLLPMCLSH